jgi:hypothetical protein
MMQENNNTRPKNELILQMLVTIPAPINKFPAEKLTILPDDMSFLFDKVVEKYNGLDEEEKHASHQL